ncbi:MAG: SPOR domain-containing protein [Gammaproteobacteria bacterium]
MDRQLAQRMVGAACLLAVLVLIVPAILDGNPESGATLTHPTVDDSLDLRTHTIRLDGEERTPPVPIPAELPSSASLPADEQLAAQPEAQPSAEATSPAVTTPGATRPLDLPVNPSAPSVSQPSGETARTAPGTASGKPASKPPATAVKEPVRALAREPVPPASPTPKPASSGSAADGNWVVQLGSFADRDNADRLAANLKRKGFPTTIEAGGAPVASCTGSGLHQYLTERRPMPWPANSKLPASLAARLVSGNRPEVLDSHRLHPARPAGDFGSGWHISRTGPRSSVADYLGTCDLDSGTVR